MKREIWKPVPGYEGLYEVSNYGRVRSHKRSGPKIRKTFTNNRGYVCIHLTKGGKVKSYLLHRLVATIFCENPECKDVVNHIDGNQLNNQATNLEWTSQKENVHKGKIVLRPVIRSDGKYYETVCATQADGFRKSGVCLCCQGKLKTHGGYYWRYADESVQATTA